MDKWLDKYQDGGVIKAQAGEDVPWYKKKLSGINYTPEMEKAEKERQAKAQKEWKNTSTSEKAKSIAIDAALAFAPELIIGKGLPLVGKMFKYFKPLKNASEIENLVIAGKDAAKMRATRMLSQEEKFVGLENKNIASDAFKNIDNQFNVAKAGDYGRSPEALGINRGKSNAVLFEDAPLTPSQQKYIASHETGHFYANTPEEATEWLSNFNPEKLTRYLMGKPIFKHSEGNRTLRSFLDKGNELARGNANEIRERAAQLKDFIAIKKRIPLSENYTMTKKELDYAIKNFVPETGLDNNMTQFFSAIKNKKGLLNTINKSALTTTGIGLGLNQKSEGVGMQNGGVVHDNMGYWNPDNIGKVVEIDSPNITMRNVKEPLIGISDIGEKKMMLPDHDYKFKGKKVREYPIGRYGIQELHELTDFSNKPSKKGWLNKYS